MSNSVLYAVNSNTQTLPIGSTINFGNIVRRYGCNCNLSGGNVVLKGTGYYNINTNFSFVAGGAGTATIALYKDGVAIPGAFASRATAEAGAYVMSIPAIVRQTCCCDSQITAVVTGVATTLNNATITVVKE